MTLYAFVALPAWFCDLTLLSRETEGRALLGLGVAGTILLVLGLASRPTGWRKPTRPAVLVLAAWTVGVGGLPRRRAWVRWLTCSARAGCCR